MAINTQYSSYSTLLSSINSTSKSYSTYTNPVTSLLDSLSTLFDSSTTIDYDKLDYVKNLSSGSKDLKTALNSLTSGSASAQNVVASSDTDSLTVKTSSVSKYSAFKDTTVKVDQVASGQVNKGTALNQDSAIESDGTYKFSIETNGKTYDFAVDVKAGETNGDLQKKMAEAVNSRNIGITASVTKDSGTSTLTLAADGTGDSDKNRFTVKDVEGNAVAKTGVSNVTQDAQNAMYSVNGGKTLTSQTNEVSLTGGVSVELKQASENAVTVSRSADKNTVTSKVNDMVNSFNSLLTAAAGNGGDNGASKLYNQLSGISKTYSASLGRIGINVGSDGSMSVDKDKFAKALDKGDVDRFFSQNSGLSYGFTGRLSKAAADVSNNPQKYSGSSFETYASSNSYYASATQSASKGAIDLSYLFNFLV